MEQEGSDPTFLQRKDEEIREMTIKLLETKVSEEATQEAKLEDLTHGMQDTLTRAIQHSSGKLLSGIKVISHYNLNKYKIYLTLLAQKWMLKS